MKDKGFAPVLILFIVGAVFVALAALSLNGKINFSLNQPETIPSPTPKATMVYSERQLNMIANKEEIKKQLNINDAQFEAILLMSADTDFSYIPAD